MTTHIQFHRSSVTGGVPDPSVMYEGEPAVNMRDKILWVKGPGADLITLVDGVCGPSAERVAGSNTQIQYNSNAGFSASSTFVFDPDTDRLGIGTDSPQESLHVHGNINSSYGFSGATGIFGSNVGIGTTRPQESLHVHGNIQSSYGFSGATGIFSIGITAPTIWNDGQINVYAKDSRMMQLRDDHSFNINPDSRDIDFVVNGDTVANLFKVDAGDDTVSIGGNLLLPDDSFIGVASNDERIIFDSDNNDITLKTNNVFIDRKLLHNGDGDTFLEFTTDEINLRAGGTDYINITSAGVNFEDNTVSRGKFKDYSETALATSTKSASFNVDFEDGNVQSFTFDDDLTVSFTNPPASGSAGTVTLIITNGGANTTAWNAAVKWPGDNAPALTSSGVDIVSFTTIDAGTTIYGFVGGINFS